MLLSVQLALLLFVLLWHVRLDELRDEVSIRSMAVGDCAEPVTL